MANWLLRAARYHCRAARGNCCAMRERLATRWQWRYHKGTARTAHHLRTTFFAFLATTQQAEIRLSLKLMTTLVYVYNMDVNYIAHNTECL